MHGLLGVGLVPEPSVIKGATLGTINVNTSVHVSKRLVVDRVRGGDRPQSLEPVEDKAEGPERAKLKQDIAQSVEPAEGRIEKTLKASRPPVQERLLFDRTEGSNGRPTVPFKESPKSPRFPKPPCGSMTKTSQITL